MDRDLAIGIAIIIGAVASPFVKIIFEFIKSKVIKTKSKEEITEDFIDCKLLVNNEYILKEVEKNYATKSIVDSLKETVGDVKKKVEEIQTTVNSIDKNLAVLASVVEERRKNENNKNI